MFFYTRFALSIIKLNIICSISVTSCYFTWIKFSPSFLCFYFILTVKIIFPMSEMLSSSDRSTLRRRRCTSFKLLSFRCRKTCQISVCGTCYCIVGVYLLHLNRRWRVSPLIMIISSRSARATFVLDSSSSSGSVALCFIILPIAFLKSNLETVFFHFYS